MSSEITEKDLLKNFEKYKKFVDDLENQYGTWPSPAEQAFETSEIEYVSVPIFFYQVHA